MKRIIIFALCALMALTAIVPVFALESEETNKSEIVVDWNDLFGENAGAPDESGSLVWLWIVVGVVAALAVAALGVYLIKKRK